MEQFEAIDEDVAGRAFANDAHSRDRREDEAAQKAEQAQDDDWRCFLDQGKHKARKQNDGEYNRYGRFHYFPFLVMKFPTPQMHPRSSPKVKLMKHNAINPATVVMELPTTEVMVFEIGATDDDKVHSDVIKRVSAVIGVIGYNICILYCVLTLIQR